MKTSIKKKLSVSIALLLLFVLWTAAVSLIDRAPIGPESSEVGFASLNGGFHRMTGVHLWLYELTDALSLIPLALCALFGILGAYQLVKRRSIFKVDGDILALGIFYLLTFGSFIFFEIFIVNYRPILIEGALEASYPSSTTMLCSCIMPTSAMQLNKRITHPAARVIAVALCSFLGAFMVAARLVSGVHWLTDIIGGAILSAGLVFLYLALCAVFQRKQS